MSGCLNLFLSGVVLLAVAITTLVAVPVPPQPTTLEITEAAINDTLIVPARNISNVYIDLVPGGAIVRADIGPRRRTVTVSVTTTITARDGAVLLYVTQVMAGGTNAPDVLVRQVNRVLIPSINDRINTLIPAQQIESVTVSHTALTVTFSPESPSG